MQNVLNSQEVERIAASLCGAAGAGIFSIEGGRNSRIYRVESNGNVFALKFFRPDGDGKRERFEAETTALDLFAEGGIEVTPRIIAKDKLNNCVLMGWIEGERVEDYGAEEIKALVAFIQKVHGLVPKGLGQKIRCATEACLNGSEVVRQIHLRLNRLATAKNEYPELRKFLDGEFMLALDDISHWSQEQYRSLGLDFLENISVRQQTLSLVDFGFHNILRRDNKLYFLDFEFFGWDDPVKLVADTLQHPGMALDEQNKQALYLSLGKIFDKDEFFLVRLKLLYPLFGLKWCMIMLNQFLPGYKPAAAKGVVGNEKQLERVRNLTKSIWQNYQEFPYDRKHSTIS